MEFSELQKSLSDPPKPCYLLYGDDEFVLARAVALISGVAGGIKEFNVVDKEFKSATALVEELMQLPVMGSYRVVIARGKLDASSVADYLDKPNPTSVLVFVSYTPHDSWNHTSTPSAPNGVTLVSCNRVDIKYIYSFVRRIAKEYGTTFPDKAVARLYNRCGGYMTRINSEAQKLSVYRAGGTVSEEDVDEAVEPDIEYVVYDLGDCIISGNTARALEIVGEMAKANDLTAAFTLLYNRFKRLFAAALDPDGLNDFGLKPYMINKLKAESAKLSKRRLKSIIDMLADADMSYKSGVISQLDALTSFVSRATYGGAD
ncbi:MAG: DNA polymerase III subunit delta [Clostridiales bacterium]|nr:DNA polymerase III subunit delta [Clostridiales bacterium]